MLVSIQGDVVETSDAEEEEEIRAAKYVYWKKEAKHETSDRNDDNSPKKRLKLGHAYDTVLEPRGSLSPRPSPLPPSSQPVLDPVFSSPPCILLSNTPKSSSLLSTPPSPITQCVSDVWDDNDDANPFQENSQDPLLLASRIGPQISKSEPHIPEYLASPVHSLYSDDESGPRSRRSLVSSAYGTPLNSLASMRLQSPVLTRSQSADPLSLFNSPLLHPTTEITGMTVPTTPDVETLHPPAQRPPSPRLTMSLPSLSISLLSGPSTDLPSSPLTPSPIINVNDYDPLFDSPPSHALQVVTSVAGGNHGDVVTPPLEFDVVNFADQPRYSLRRREANQIKPYTIEKLQYKKALSSNPDAIVKFRSPTRGGRHRHNDAIGDSQEQWGPYAADDDEPHPHYQESLQADPNTIPASGLLDGGVRPPIQYSEFLQDLPTTDEEEAKELKALSKEARKAVRERKAREAKEKLYKRKPKSFPFSKSHMAMDGSPSQPRSKRSMGTHVSTTDLQYPRNSASQEPNRPPTPIFISTIPSELFSEPANDLRPMSPTELFDHREDPSVGTSNVIHNIPMDNSEPQSDVESDNTDGEQIRHPGSISDEDGDGDLPGEPLDRRSMKALSRMVPAFMLKHLAKDTVSSKPARKRQRSVTVAPDSDDNDEGSELRPGETRTRWARQPKGDIEIRGDTESSDDERSSLTDSELEGTPNRYYPDAYSPQGRIIPEVITISDSSEELQESSDEGVDDETIQAYLDGKNVTRKPYRTGQRREESLIDWMLSRAQTIGGPKKVKAKKQPTSNTHARKASSQTKYKMDVITNRAKGMGRERQSKLNFSCQSGTTEGRSSSHWTSGFPPAPMALHGSDIGDEGDIGYSHDEVFVPSIDGASRKKTRREKAKEKRARAKANGVYTFRSNDTQVVTGRRARGMVTIDIEEDDFNGGPAWCSALTPSLQTASAIHNSRNNLKKISPPLQSSRTIQNASPNEQEAGSSGVQDRPPRRKIKRPGDFGIPLLHSGLSLAATTFVGKGALRELCEIVSSSAAPPISNVTVLRGIEVGPSTSLEDFTKSLKEVLSGLFDLATGLPALDSADEAKEWSILTRVCCQFLSWRLDTWGESDCSRLRAAVQESVSELVLQIRKLCLGQNTLDISIFSLCWLLVELSVRLGQTIQRQSPNSLSEAIALLIQHLLEYDIEKTMAPVCSGSLLDSSTTAGYTAELWVCLFHILDTHHRMAPDTKPHPFWPVFQRGLESVSSSMNPLAASEAIWKGIFSLCALTQFSMHGMTMAKSRLPANWELVVIALKKVSLNANPVTDTTQPSSHLDKRDVYANLAVRRCVDLSHRWEWSLEQSSNVFNQLAEIFRSRKFANLRHEAPDYPRFMRDNKWDLHLDYRRGDSAFVLFLRLLVKAADYDPTNPTRTPSPRAKKLLSLAIPVGSLAFSKSHPTAIRDLSTLSVRLAAIAVGIHIDPTSHASRIAHARTYVKFSDADDTTRKAVIRGIQYLATLMVTWKVPLDAVSDWIGAVAGELVDELKNIPKTPNYLTKRNGVSIIIPVLVGCVRHIFEAHQTCSEYPEPTLFSSLVRIFFISSLATETKTLDELRFLVEAVLDARAAAIPPPERPRLAPLQMTENQESQDDYGDFDLDFNDPALLAALGDVQAPAVGRPAHAGKEERMRQAMKTTQSHYFAWRGLNGFLKDPQEHRVDREYFGIADSWIYCWVGATLMAAEGGSERVSGKIFKLWDPFREALQRDILDRRQRRVDLTVMLCLLKLDPMSYLEIQDRYLKVLMNCLVAMEVDLDSEYVGLLFSVDGLRHPLLAGAPCERESEAVDFKMAPEEFEAVSLEILQSILRNLAALCDDGAPDRDKYVDLVRGMLSTMRRLSMDERWKSRPAYVERCRRVVRMVREHVGDRWPGLAFFMDWERTLE